MPQDRTGTRTGRRRWLDPWQWAMATVCALVVLELILEVGSDGFVSTVANLGQLLFAALATFHGIAAARRSTGRMRTCWTVLSTGLASWTLGQVIWCGYELIGRESAPFPSLADVFFLLFSVGAVAGLWLFPTLEKRRDRLRRLLDALIIVTALVSISWSTTLGAVVRAGSDSDLGSVVGPAYAISDILIVAMAVLCLSLATGHRTTLILVTVAMLAMSVADSGFAYFSALGTYRTGGLFDAGWISAFLLLAIAARNVPAAVEEEPVQESGPEVRHNGASMLPYVPFVIALVTLGARYLTGYRPGQVEGLCLGLAVIIVMVRQYLTLLDNHRLLAVVAAREGQLKRQAFHDQLTGLANRALFNDRVAHALELHRRDLRPLALMFCDLDDFKAVNDTLGHAAGDELLIRVGERLRGAVRAGDTLARFGGDEFAILIEDGGESADVGNRIIESLRAPFLLGEIELVMRASIGVISVAADDPSPPLEALLAKADIAMYTAKRGGKGRLALYESTMSLPPRTELELRESLTKAIAAQVIQVVYQPIVSLHSGEIVGLEALARWQHNGESVTPAEFIPLAIRAGLIAQLTDQILDRTCADLSRWSEGLGHDRLRVNINAPAALITDPHFPTRVTTALDRWGLPGSQLMLEITEDALTADWHRSREVVGALDRAGVRIALEDFGTGNTSLLHLQRIPFHTVKIDLALISEVDAETGAERFLRALLTLAHDLGLEVTAEGVERAAQADMLREYGYHFAQGYFLARPMPAADIGQLLGISTGSRSGSTRRPSGISSATPPIDADW